LKSDLLFPYKETDLLLKLWND